MRHSNQTIVGLTLLLAGCPAVEPIDEDQTAGVPTEVQRIFTESCVAPACHDSASAAQGLSLEAGVAGNILTATAQQVPLPLVARGNVAGSYIAIKMLPEDFEAEVPRVGGIMPPPGQHEISQEDLALVIGWIAGAPLPGGGSGETEGETDTDTDTDTVDETDGEPMVLSCALEDIKPGAPNPIEAGTGVGEIPPDIADALEVNCGCHYAGLPYERPLPPYTGVLDMATWAGFHEEHSFPLCQDDLAYLCVLERLDHNLPMPPSQCSLEDGSRISEDDLDLLYQWLEEGAPDGATWEP